MAVEDVKAVGILFACRIDLYDEFCNSLPDTPENREFIKNYNRHYDQVCFDFNSDSDDLMR